VTRLRKGLTGHLSLLRGGKDKDLRRSKGRPGEETEALRFLVKDRKGGKGGFSSINGVFGKDRKNKGQGPDGWNIMRRVRGS